MTENVNRRNQPITQPIPEEPQARPDREWNGDIGSKPCLHRCARLLTSPAAMMSSNDARLFGLATLAPVYNCFSQRTAGFHRHLAVVA